MRGWSWLLVLLMHPVFGASGGDTAPPDHAVELRSWNEDALRELRNDPALYYDRDLRRMPSPWERFKEWLRAWLDRWLGSRVGNAVIENLLYIIAAIVLLFALILLSRGGLRRVFHGAPRSLAEVITVEEDIRELDLAAMIAEAEAGGDLRRAIRLHYLSVLRKLVERGVLHWSPDRTDRDYIAQISDPAQRAHFSKAALLFQWVWYGHASVSPSNYAELRRTFTEFEHVTTT